MFPYLGSIMGPLQQIQQFRHKTSPRPSEQLEMSRRALLAYTWETHIWQLSDLTNKYWPPELRAEAEEIWSPWEKKNNRKTYLRCNQRKVIYLFIYLEFSSCLDLICSEDRTRWWIVFVQSSPPPTTSQHLDWGYLFTLINIPPSPAWQPDWSLAGAVNITISI